MKPTVLTGECACDQCGTNLFPDDSAFTIPQSDGSQTVYCGNECLVEQYLEKQPGTFTDAITGLREFYPRLLELDMIEHVRSLVTIRDTGNQQLDYENARDQVESLVKDFLGYETKLVTALRKRLQQRKTWRKTQQWADPISPDYSNGYDSAVDNEIEFLTDILTKFQHETPNGDDNAS